MNKAIKTQRLNNRQSMMGIQTLRNISVKKPLHVECVLAVRSMFAFMGRMVSCNATENMTASFAPAQADSRVFAMNDHGKWSMVRQ